MNEPDPLVTAQSLGESFAALVGATEWQLDTPAEIGVTPEQAQPEEFELAPTEPPLAEAVNDATIPPSPLQIIEALLFVGGSPLQANHVAETIRNFTDSHFQESIQTLNHVYQSQNRPYKIVLEGEGYVIRLLPKFASVREKMIGGPRESRLNQSALDVLSLIAYRQPIGRAEIDSIRGADSATIVRQLIRLGLVASAISDESGTKETLYSTTSKFLEIFRVRELEDLPKIGIVKRI